MCAQCWWNQKRASDPLGQEFLEVVNCHVCIENETQLLEEQLVLLTTVLSLQPHFSYFRDRVLLGDPGLPGISI